MDYCERNISKSKKKKQDYETVEIFQFLYETERYIVGTFPPTSMGNIFSRELQQINLKTCAAFSNKILFSFTEFDGEKS